MLRSLELFPPLSQPCSQARPPPSVPESPLPPPLPPQRALTLWSWPQESHPNGHQLPEPNSQSVQPKLQSFLRAAGAVLPSRGDIANPSLPPAQTTAVFSFQWREDHTYTFTNTSAVEAHHGPHLLFSTRCFLRTEKVFRDVWFNRIPQLS